MNKGVPSEQMLSYYCTYIRYSRTQIIRIIWGGVSSGYAENPDNWIFFGNRLHYQIEVRLKLFMARISGITRNFVRGGGGVSTNSVEGTGQRERGFGGGSPLVRGSA
jgi:hypothetical protein